MEDIASRSFERRGGDGTQARISVR
jgi:hypothetical protein